MPSYPVARRELSLDAEEAILLALCVQTIRKDAPLPIRDPGPDARPEERLAWRLKRIVPDLVRAHERHSTRNRR